MHDEIVAAGMISSNVGNTIDKLHNTITEFNEQSEMYSKRMHRLTWAMLILALVMAGMVGFQIYLMLNP
jgi:hypothetical protein